MAKPYNHRRAENKYKKWKEKDEQFMEKNGMPMDKILLMRDFDRVQFNSDRRFFEKVDYDSEEEFGFEMQLIIFLMYRGYSAREVSKITGISEWTICRRLAKLNYAYQIRKTNK